MDSKVLRDLCEAYSEIYDDGFNAWVNSLIEEGYDLSDYTWEDMCEFYLQEDAQGFGASLRQKFGQARRAFGDVTGAYAQGFIGQKTTSSNPLARGYNALSRTVSAPTRALGDVAKGFVTGKGSSSKPKPASEKSSPKPEVSNIPTKSSKPSPYNAKNLGADQFKAYKAGGGDAAMAKGTGTASEIIARGRKAMSAKPAGGTGDGGTGNRGVGASPRPSGSTPAAKAPATAKSAPSAPKAATGTLGKTSFERRTPTSAELKAAQAARASGANPEQALQAAKSAEQTKKDFTRTDIKMPSYMKNSFSWGSTSKLVDDIADAYQSVYEAKKVDQDKDGDNDFADIQIARMIASGVPKEVAIAKVKGKSYNEEIELGEETEEERKRNERRARIAELQAQGRVMTSAKRTSARAKERREEQKAEKLEKLANAALEATRGATRRSSKPMGSTNEPEAKSAAPKANRKLSSSVKNDRLASRADELLRMLQNEDFQLWVEELLDEGYTLENWTDEELVSLYEEILEEKYGTAAGRKKLAKKTRAGKDIGKKGPGFQNMVDKLTPKYGKERATKIAAAQMWKTHA